MGKKPRSRDVPPMSNVAEKRSDPTSMEPKKQSVLAFYSDKPDNAFREFSNFYRQHHSFEFVLPEFARRTNFPRSIWCDFSEKAIMATKAALMNDSEAFLAIDEATEPKCCKDLGRGVRNFDEVLWQSHLEETAFEVVKQKFASDKRLRELLLSTGNAIIAEAAPNDCIWGIGLRKTDPRVKDQSQWQGRNVLGFALMQARDHLKLQSCTDTHCEDKAVISTDSPKLMDDDSKRSKSSKVRRWGGVVPKSCSPSFGNATAVHNVHDSGSLGLGLATSSENATSMYEEKRVSTRGSPNSTTEYEDNQISTKGSEHSKSGYEEKKSSAKKHGQAKTSDLYLPMLSAEQVGNFTVKMEDVETSLRSTLDRYGCAIVTDVAGPEECKHLESLFKDDILELIDHPALQTAASVVTNAAQKVETDVKQWPEASMKLLGELNRCQLRGLPHGRFAWGCRLLPNLRRCYEIIHSRTDLVSSCDNPFFAPPAQREQIENRHWPHVDQNSNDKRFFDDEGVPVGDWEVYQGLLYVWSSEGSHASTTVVLPGSHLDVYDELMQDPSMQQRGPKGDHFSLVSRLSQKDLQNRIEKQWHAGAGRVPVPRGGLFLWSSRTLHQGWTGGPRLAQPVCWEPAGRRDRAALDRKLRLAALGLPSTHWASLGIPHTLVAAKLCEPTAADCSKNQACLPMRSSLHPVSLRGDVDIAEMWRRLEGHPWKSLSDELREFIMTVLTDDIKNAL